MNVPVISPYVKAEFLEWTEVTRLTFFPFSDFSEQTNCWPTFFSPTLSVGSSRYGPYGTGD